MTITLTDNHTRHGSETVTFRYGHLRDKPAYGCVFSYTNARKEKAVRFQSDLFSKASEYDAVLLAVKRVEQYIKTIPDGDARLIDRAWRQYLDTKQQKLFGETD